MANEGDKPQLSIDELAKIACDVTLRDGQHIPAVFVQGIDSAAMGQIADLPSTHEGRVERLFQVGFSLGRDGLLGLLVQAYFITEGWMVVTDKKELEIMPSEDPDRIEVLIISGINLLKETGSMLIFEMIREAGKLVDLQEHSRQEDDAEKMYNPLLDALVAGYVMGQGKIDLPPA